MRPIAELSVVNCIAKSQCSMVCTTDREIKQFQWKGHKFQLAQLLTIN